MHHLRVTDMTCNHCVQSITTAIRSIDPDAQLAADLPRHHIAVDSRLAPEQLLAALNEAGFSASMLDQAPT